MYEQIARNKRRTFVMLAAFVLLIAAVAVALGVIFRAGVAIVPIAIVIAIVMAWTSYFASDKIAYSRQFYNDSVLGYNNKIQAFPANVLAGAFNFTPREYFEGDPTEQGPVSVQF